MLLDYPLLEALAAVVRTGSFDRGARELHVTPSAVSQRVKLLEERIGKVLVVRGQPAKATPAGAALCRHFETVALLEHELHERLPDLVIGTTPTAVRPTIRIAANADSVATWLVPALARFAARDAVLFDVAIEDQDHTETMLRAGEVHGAVTTQSEPVQGCHARKLGALRYLATCTPAFHARHFGAGVTREALRMAPCLVFNAKDRMQHRFVRKVIRGDVELPAHWMPSPQAFLDGCLGELGWGMNPEPMVRAHLQRRELVELVPARRIDVDLYWQSWRLTAPTLERLSELLVAEARRRLRQSRSQLDRTR